MMAVQQNTVTLSLAIPETTDTTDQKVASATRATTITAPGTGLATPGQTKGSGSYLPTQGRITGNAITATPGKASPAQLVGDSRPVTVTAEAGQAAAILPTSAAVEKDLARLYAENITDAMQGGGPEGKEGHPPLEAVQDPPVIGAAVAAAPAVPPATQTPGDADTAGLEGRGPAPRNRIIWLHVAHRYLRS